MADLIRSAKSENDWSKVEPTAYNIQIVERSLLQAFFNTEQMPLLPVELGDFRTTDNRDDAADDDTYRLLRHLDIAHSPKAGQEAATNVFAQKLLETVRGYSAGRRILMILHVLSLFICGSAHSTVTQTDVCIIQDTSDIILLVQEDKQLDGGICAGDRSISA
ncbi:hypothetical protein PHLCEN_2v9627 [Hermanssonia centrifuga]|uniref:Uncharacterized protein n=1 Tax=Hermanssonia centrifuga TaxID=98765 RepID=A0A2R6NQE5_9APHY|nr:hypothetical protein PHLCEN_2v9627 [Hermanssonia centrifuga]